MPTQGPGRSTPTIGSRVRRFRNERGLALNELAALSGTSKSYLSEIENSTRGRPGAAILHNLAAALGVTIADILGQSTPPDLDTAIPEPLLHYAREHDLPETDLQMLAAIRFRGEQPKTAQRWEFIYNAIKNSAGMDTQL